MTLRADILMRLLFDYTNPLDLTTGRERDAYTLLQRVTDGTGSGRARWIFFDQVSLAPAETASFAFNGAGVEDIHGRLIDFALVNLVIVRNRTTTAGNYAYISACPGTKPLIWTSGTAPRVWANGIIRGRSPAGRTTGASKTLTIVGGVGTNVVDVVAMGSN